MSCDGQCAYIMGSSVPEYSKDGETYELQWAFDVRFLADEPYHSLTPLQPSQHRPYVWEEAPESSASRANRSRRAGSIDEGI
jgi:hypothetical protein